MPPLLEVQRLSTVLTTERGPLFAVHDADVRLERGASIGLVGESGSGKTQLALSLMRLLPPGAQCSGSVLLDGENLLELPERAMRAVRGRRIGMVFQEPLNSLDPVFTIGSQITEALRLHQRLGRSEARARAAEALREVGIADPVARLDSYPHELSGGMRQRALLAIALACRPDLLIADEPTTALDTTVQAQILELLGHLRRARGMALLLVSHDLGVVARLCESVAVMYGGCIVERGPTAELLERPAHPYTRALLDACRPSPCGVADGRRPKLATIPGRVPDLHEPPSGCRFAARCPRAGPDCSSALPALLECGSGRAVACIRPEPAVVARAGGAP